MSSRPRAFRRGRRALVRRRRGWGRAAALVVAEHPCFLAMGRCLVLWMRALRRRDSPFLLWSGLWTSDATSKPCLLAGA